MRFVSRVTILVTFVTAVLALTRELLIAFA
jgi:hypothetical protein